MQVDNDQGEIGSIQGTMYAPADFPDMEITHRASSTMTNAVSNVTLYHISDVSEKLQQTRLWRRKVREIIQNHQERIIQFFTKPIPNDHPLKSAHTLLTKYGKVTNSVDSTRNPPQFFKDFLVDVSGVGYASLNKYIDDLLVKLIISQHKYANTIIKIKISK